MTLADWYKENGEYRSFAGHDITLALANHSLDDGDIDQLYDATSFDLDQQVPLVFKKTFTVLTNLSVPPPVLIRGGH